MSGKQKPVLPDRRPKSTGRPFASLVLITLRAFLLAHSSLHFFYTSNCLPQALRFCWFLDPHPFFAITDRIEFDGRRLIRTGLLPRIWALWTGRRYRIKLIEIERVSTEVLNAIRRGSNLRYTYRTAFFGKQREFAILSSRPDYIPLLRAILPKLDQNLLDHRTLDLMENLVDTQEIAAKVRAIQLPPADVLESSIENFRLPSGSLRKSDVDVGEAEKAKFLLRLADELRVSGHLPQAIEAFRRAVRSMPPDANVLLNFRPLSSYICLNSRQIIAGSQRAGYDAAGRATRR